MNRIDGSNHLVLLCKNETGYKNLIKMVSAGFTEGFYNKPRVDHELLEEYHEGLICLSACLAGEIPQALLAGDYEKAKNLARYYEDLFGKGNYYIEIQDHELDEQRTVLPLSLIHIFSLDKVVEKLRLEVVYTPTELKNIPIYTADVNRPGLLLTGYDEYFDPTRIQIFGNAEVGYLTTLPESERRSHIHTLFAAKPPALIVTRNLSVFDEVDVYKRQALDAAFQCCTVRTPG